MENKIIPDGYLSAGQKNRMDDINRDLIGGIVVGVNTPDSGENEMFVVKNNGKYYNVEGHWNRDDGSWYTHDEIKDIDTIKQ